MTFTKLLKMCFTVAMFVLGANLAPAMAQSGQPNVVLMLADNLG
jgi:hypothetical protein